jgi:hypothetical protein
MSNLRQHWQGVSLPGDHLLDQWLEGDDTAAFFQTPPGPDGRRNIVKLVPETETNRDIQLSRWSRIRRLQHSNLVELLDCGWASLDEETVLFAVFEAPDDTLGQATLTPEEALDVRTSVLDALRYLHAESLVLGTLDRDHIVAIGDRIKVTTDSIRPAVGPSDFADDIRALDELFPPPAVQPAPPPPEPSVPYHFPKWIVVGTAAVLFLILGLNLRRPTAAEPPPATPVTSLPAPVPPEPKPSPVPHKEMWRVIAFTYHTEEAAAKKVRQINQNHPGLHAAVFSPRHGKDFLVVLGGPMSHEDALRLQHSARGKGLPRDLYVQNFRE